jgi:fumarate hydratase class I
MPDICAYQDLFPLAKDKTLYTLLTTEHVSTREINGEEYVFVQPEGLTLLAREAFIRVNHKLRTSHLMQLAAILEDPRASDNDKYVALEMLNNAAIAAEGVFPLCQDTGTATIMGKRGQRVLTEGNDEAALSEGVRRAYTEKNLRYSQNAPLTMYSEKNTGCNLPAQIDIYAKPGASYDFLFVAKGGGSANKTSLFQQTKAALSQDALLSFLVDKMAAVGTAACPPYHLAFVVGGTSAEANLKTVKLATTGYLDGLPGEGGLGGHAFRDFNLEYKLLRASQELGFGAQFGGKYFCLDVRVIRLPRHGASCPIGMGVSCSADRNAKGKITGEGIFIETLEEDPARFIPKDTADILRPPVYINLEQPMDAIRAVLTKYPVSTRFLLSGRIVVARDIAHARLKERMDRGEGLPGYFKDHVVLYAGPAKTPEGYPCGACGPTTSGRMDPYVPLFQKQGASLVMLGKGNRSKAVTESCQKYGGFYLGSIGGPAARLGRDCITGYEILEYPELGMEAVSMITAKDFPAFLIVDDKGHDFFANLYGQFEVIKASRYLKFQ